MQKTDQIGYDYEIGNSTSLKHLGYGKLIVYANPINPYAWKRKRGMGVDMVLKVNNHTLYVEESFCTHDYTYRESWFVECRLSRFKGYPNDSTHHHVILTNRPPNFNHVKSLFNGFITDFNGLIQYINQLIYKFNHPNPFYNWSTSNDSCCDSSLCSNSYSLTNSLSTNYDNNINPCMHDLQLYKLITKIHRLTRHLYRKYPEIRFNDDWIKD